MSFGSQGSRGRVPGWNTQEGWMPPDVARRAKGEQSDKRADFQERPVVTKTGNVLGIASTQEQWLELSRQRIEMEQDSRL